MSLKKEQVNKIKFDALVQKRLMLLQDIANREAAIMRWEEVKEAETGVADPMRPHNIRKIIEDLEDKNEDDENFIKVLDKMIDEYDEKNRIQKNGRRGIG